LKHLKDIYGVFPIHPYFLVSSDCNISDGENINKCLFVIMNNGSIFCENILSTCRKTQESNSWRYYYSGHKRIYSFDDKNNAIVMKCFSLQNGADNNYNSPVRSSSRDIIVDINIYIDKPMLSKSTVDYLRNIISNDVSKFNHIVTSDFYYMPVIEFDLTIAKSIVQYDKHLLDNYLDYLPNNFSHHSSEMLKLRRDHIEKMKTIELEMEKSKMDTLEKEKEFDSKLTTLDEFKKILAEERLKVDEDARKNQILKHECDAKIKQCAFESINLVNKDQKFRSENIREKNRLGELEKTLAKKEFDLKSSEERFKLKENDLLDRMLAIKKKEDFLNDKEDVVKKNEYSLKLREETVLNKEKLLNVRKF
jgi:hypothetical protein